MSFKKVIFILIILSSFVMAINSESHIFIKVDVKGFPYYWNGSVFEPAPVVYFISMKDAYWAEVGINVTMPLADGPFITVPKRALNPSRPPPKGKPVETPRGKVWIYLTDKPATEQLQPYAIVLYLGENRKGEIYAAEIREGGKGPLFAPLLTSYNTYLFTLQSPPITVGPTRAVLSFKNATGFTSSADYVLGSAYRAYLGYRVQYIYLAVAGSGSYTASLDVFCSDTPTTSPPYCGSLGVLYSYNTDYGIVFVFDNWNYINKYIWVSAYLSSATFQTVRATLSAHYLRPSSSDSSWGAMVFQWRSIATPGGRTWSTSPPSGAKRIMVTTPVPQGSATPSLKITDLYLVNCNGASQRIRFYVGYRQVYELSLSGSAVGDCYAFSHTGFTISILAALDYVRLNTSHVPIIIEFDPPLKSGSSSAPIFYGGIELQGERWPQIWRENSNNWINDGLKYLGIRRYAMKTVGDVYYFNLWNKQSFKNESGFYPGLLAKVGVETQQSVDAVSATPRITVSYIGVLRETATPYISYVCIAQSTTNIHGLNVTGAGNLQAIESWASAADLGYWIINTIINMISLAREIPSYVGFILWAAGELITKALPSSTSCSVNSFQFGLAFSDPNGLYVTRSALYCVNLENSLEADKLTAQDVTVAIYVSMIRDKFDPSDYGYFTLYGRVRQLWLRRSAMNTWFDGPVEPYRNDGGILVRVS